MALYQTNKILQIKLFSGFDHPCGTSSWSLLRAPDLCTGFHCERDNHKSELLTSCFRPISWQPQKRDNAEIAILMCALYGFKFIPFPFQNASLSVVLPKSSYISSAVIIYISVTHKYARLWRPILKRGTILK